jgi:Zn-dependent M28 family amino/carboxypeptidase
MFRKPKLLVFVDRSELARLTASDERRFALTISGRPVRLTSANVIGEVAGNAGASRQIIVSAHLDAYRTSPGASDNASGVGVLIELARHFKSLGPRLKTRVTLVGFGAEELGVLGSRAYVSKHAQDLRDCVLQVNIDAIGGPSGPFVVTLGGVSGLPAHVGEHLFPPDLMDKAWEGVDSGWRLLDLRLLTAAKATNRPEWLKLIVDECSNALGIGVEHSGNSGSDDLSFTQAGVAATSVGYGGGPQHSPEDAVGQVRKANLTAVGRLVACVVEGAGAGPSRR